MVAGSPGLREAGVVRVEEDDEGVTLVHERVEHHDAPGLWLAACLGRFAAVDLPAVRFFRALGLPVTATVDTGGGQFLVALSTGRR